MPSAGIPMHKGGKHIADAVSRPERNRMSDAQQLLNIHANRDTMGGSLMQARVACFRWFTLSVVDAMALVHQFTCAQIIRFIYA